MSKPLRIGPILFNADFLTAVRDDGLEVRFTRTETCVLKCFVQNTGSVLTRNQLLDAISGAGSEKSDRNIDFTINRLRRKLADPATDPRFIATRYGEGYVWLAQQATKSPLACGAKAVVGPIRGLDNLGDMTPQAQNFIDTFFKVYRAGFSQSLKVVLDKDCPPRTVFEGDSPEIGVDLTFFAEIDRLECVVRVTSFDSGHIYLLTRKTIWQDANATDKAQEPIPAIAQQLSEDIWKSLATQPETSTGLPYSILKASETYRRKGAAPSERYFDDIKSWKTGDAKLREILAKDPTDYPVMLMRAVSLHSKYILCGVELFASGQDTCAEDETEIETLVATCLPFVQDQPDMAISAAKLLYFVGHGHRRAAMELAENAHKRGTSVAASLATVGQMRVFLGEIELGLAALHQARQLSEDSSRFKVGVSHLICQALAAVGDQDALNKALANTDFLNPQSKFFAYISFSDPKNPAPEALAALPAINFNLAQALLKYANYISARLFVYPEHRANILRPAVTLFKEKFGEDVIPAEVTASVPLKFFQ